MLDDVTAVVLSSFLSSRPTRGFCTSRHSALHVLIRSFCSTPRIHKHSQQKVPAKHAKRAGEKYVFNIPLRMLARRIHFNCGTVHDCAHGTSRVPSQTSTLPQITIEGTVNLYYEKVYAGCIRKLTSISNIIVYVPIVPQVQYRNARPLERHPAISCFQDPLQAQHP
jgi:hypothetical protein